MYYHININALWVWTLGLLITFNLSAQNTQTITLLDAEQKEPIIGASFSYGQLNGFSDELGQIAFEFLPETKMYVSHINYGSWIWNQTQLEQILKEKLFYRKSQSIKAYPVTIIALRGNQNPDESIHIKHQDRMEHDATAILKQSPAIGSIKKSGSYGFDPVFRGFKYDQLNIVFNGAQSATAACPNRMDPPTSQMAPNMMQRIEVLKGPYALRYGVGVGGTIHFIPSPLAYTKNLNTFGRLSTAYESNQNNIKSEAQIGWSQSNYNLAFFGAWSQGEDYSAGDGTIIPSDYQRGSFGTQLGLKLASNQELKVSATYNIARDVDFPGLPMDLRKDDTWMINARHDISLGNEHLKSWSTSLYGSFVDHLMDNLLKPLNPRMMDASTAAQTYNYGGRTEGNWMFGSNRLYAGIDARVEGAKGYRTRTFLLGPNAGKSFEDNAWQEAEIFRSGLFGEYHMGKSSWRYTLSGRLEANHAQVLDASDEFTNVYNDTEQTQINLSVSTGVTKQVLSNVQVGLWLGRAQRSGSLTERYINYFPVGLDPFEMLGNPNLNPEVNHQADLTLEWNTSETAFTVDVFASYLTDYISSVIDPELSPRLPNSPGVRTFINIEDAFKTGFEVNWKQNLMAGLQHQFGIAYTYGQDLEREEPLPEIAPLDIRYALSGAYLGDKLRPSVHVRYVTAQNRISTEFGETNTPSFVLLGFDVSYAVSPQFTVQAGVQNLLDELYYEHLNRSVRGANQPIFDRGRNITVAMNYTFN